MTFLLAQNLHNTQRAFDNYVDKKRGGGGSVESPSIALSHDKAQVLCKMFTIIHLSGGGGQIWVKFAPRSN